MAQLFQESFIVAIGTYDDDECSPNLIRSSDIFFIRAIRANNRSLVPVVTYCVDDSIHNRRSFTHRCTNQVAAARDRTRSTPVVVSNNFRQCSQVVALITRMSMHAPPSSPFRFRMTRGLSKRSLIESSAKTSFSPRSSNAEL